MTQHQKKSLADSPELAFRISLSVLILLIGIGIFIFFKVTKPKTTKEKPQRIPPLVDYIEVKKENHQVNVPVLGTVSPAKEVVLKSWLNGDISMVSPEFIPGGLFNKGDVILKIDPADYLLDVKRKKAALNSAKASLDIEMGYQDVAKEELSLMEVTSGEKVKDKQLALRKPQLSQAQAKYDAASADLEAANLNLDRTVIKAPFNCMLTDVNVAIGARISAQLGLGTITGTDQYWIKASVPVSRLKWIDIPANQSSSGSKVKIKSRYQGETSEEMHTGEVIRLTGRLSEQSRMATLLVRVSDPLLIDSSDKRTPLILGSFVSLIIEGHIIKNTIAIPRKSLRDDDTVWVYNDGKLHIKTVTPLWKGESEIYLKSGLNAGENLIISTLSSPIDGMKLTDKKKKNDKTKKEPSKQLKNAS